MTLQFYFHSILLLNEITVESTVGLEDHFLKKAAFCCNVLVFGLDYEPNSTHYFLVFELGKSRWRDSGGD